MGYWTLGPGVSLRSLRAALQLGLPKPLSLPVLVGPNASLETHNDARIELGGRLYLGVWPKKEEPSLEQAVRTGAGAAPARPTTLYMGQEAQLSTQGWVLMGPGTQIVIGPTAELRVGAGSYVSGNSQILASSRITVGSECAIAWDVMVMDSDSHSLSVAGEQRPQTVPVEIGNHVWIGAGVMILKGAKIGDGAVVAAGSLVTGVIPPKCLAAGRPARVIKEDVDWH